MTDARHIPLVSPSRPTDNQRTRYVGAVHSILAASRYRVGDGAARDVEQLLGAELELPASWGVAALRSGTDSLIRALRLVGVGPGRTVVVPDNAFHAVAASVLSVGAEPVFADVDPAAWNLSPSAVAEILETTPVHAVVAVDNYGTPAPLAELAHVVKSRGIPLILDACESLGAERPNASVVLADAIVVSFSFTKPIHAVGMGGALAAPQELVSRCWHEAALLSSQFRMPEMNAAFLIETWDDLGQNVDRLRDIYARYTEALRPSGFEPQHEADRSTRIHAPFLAPPGLRGDELVAALAARDIESRSMFRSQSRLFDMGSPPSVAAEVDQRILCLPSGVGLRDRDLASVVEALRTTLGTRSR